jgi:hypothetical protein
MRHGQAPPLAMVRASGRVGWLSLLGHASCAPHTASPAILLEKGVPTCRKPASAAGHELHYLPLPALPPAVGCWRR